MGNRRILLTAILCFMVGLSACGKLAKEDSAGGENNGGQGKPGNRFGFDTSQYPNVDNAIYGQWVANQSEKEQDASHLTRVFINQSGRVGVSVECDFHGKGVLVAGFEINATVGDRQVSLDEKGSAETKGTVDGRPAICSASVEKVTLGYTVRGDSLRLFVLQGGGSMWFNRIR